MQWGNLLSKFYHVHFYKLDPKFKETFWRTTFKPIGTIHVFGNKTYLKMYFFAVLVLSEKTS